MPKFDNPAYEKPWRRVRWDGPVEKLVGREGLALAACEKGKHPPTKKVKIRLREKMETRELGGEGGTHRGTGGA